MNRMRWAETSSEADLSYSRVEQIREVLVFLFLIVPSMALSFFAVRQGSLTFPLTASATIVRDLALVSLIAFFLWRNGEPAARIGWTQRNVLRNVILGAALFAPLLYGVGVLQTILKVLGFSAPATPAPRSLRAEGAWEFVLAGILVVVVAITEEIIFRGYLMLRLTAATRHPMAAAVLSSIIFALGHGYEGTAGAITVGVMGFIFALVYLSTRSLVAPIVMHFLQDFIGIVLVPLLSHHP